VPTVRSTRDAGVDASLGTRALEGIVGVMDGVIGVVAPRWALHRLQSRVQLSAMEDLSAHGLTAYTGGSLMRRGMGGWLTSRGSPDADVLPTLPLLRTRSRDLERNVPLATGAIAGVVTSVVGTGLSFQCTVDRDALKWDDETAEDWQATTEREWRLWAETTDCDITRHQDFYGLQDLVFRSALVNGDAITLLPFVPRKGSLYDLRAQIIEADRLCNKDFAVDTPLHAGGVVMDEHGAPIAYDILEQHPGGLWVTSRTWNTYPAFGAKTGRRNVLHHFRRVRPGQTRGIPYLAPVIEIVKQIGRYADAEVMAAVVAGMFTGFITSEQGGLGGNGIPGVVGGTTDAAQTDDIRMGYGTLAELRTGEKIEFGNPGRPNPNFDKFMEACVRQIGVGLEIPFEVLIKHFTASYTAARAALLEAWKFYRGRRAWLVQSFCQPVYEAWLEEAVAIGRIQAPGFFDDPALRRAYCGSAWHGDAMPQVDPLKDINAAIGRVELGISDRVQETAQLTGGDWDSTNDELIREATLRKEGGLDPAPPVQVGKTVNPKELAAETDTSGAPAKGSDLESGDTETAPPVKK
jgi:lambda family phage portal protein